MCRFFDASILLLSEMKMLNGILAHCTRVSHDMSMNAVGLTEAFLCMYVRTLPAYKNVCQGLWLFHWYVQ